MLNKEWKIRMLLLVLSLFIYLIYFHNIFFNINSVLSSITLDTLKNYYTYIYHIKNDSNWLLFGGMNYPYGEHVVFTDCQPILTFILRPLTFLHPYLIGILHGLMFVSFIISPVILYSVFRRLEQGRTVSFFVSLSLSLLAPQFLKINAGHFALAYGCIIPAAILFLIRIMDEDSRKDKVFLLIFNSCLFFLHPYLGFSVSVFVLLSLAVHGLHKQARTKILNRFFTIVLTGILPAIIFKMFMFLTDNKTDRPVEPFGLNVMVENTDSLLSPEFGPFQKIMSLWFNNRPLHFEGHTYLGFFIVVMSVIVFLALPFTFKRVNISKQTVSIFVASFMLLLLSFGMHNTVLQALNVESQLLNQFRASSRFAWFFYYALPMLIVPIFVQLINRFVKYDCAVLITRTVAILFFCFYFVEAHFYFRKDESAFWSFKNIFRTEALSESDWSSLKVIRSASAKAIIPLPIYHGGSEIYERAATNDAMLLSMLYSFHSSVPIISVMLSRTSLKETKEVVNLLNPYKQMGDAFEKAEAGNYFIIKTAEALMPDEERLWQKCEVKSSVKKMSYGLLKKDDLSNRPITQEKMNIHADSVFITDDLIYVPFAENKPFVTANMQDYEKIYTLDSNNFNSGTYVMSFHFYGADKTYKGVALNIIVAETSKNFTGWIYNLPVRVMSGFYNDFSVFEYSIELKRGSKYEFLAKGLSDHEYKISNFMLRAKSCTVISSKSVKHSAGNQKEDKAAPVSRRSDTLINNFPIYAL